MPILETVQEVYEFQRAFFLEQGSLAKYATEYDDDDVPPEEVEWTCLYRTEDGRKCAVGCLIDDEVYFSPVEGHSYVDNIGQAIENSGVITLPKLDPRLRAIVNGEGEEGQRKLRFLQETQSAHDDGATETVEDFILRLDTIARSFGLRIVA